MRRLQPLSNDAEGAPGSSLQAIKTQQRAREEDERVRLKRVKGTIVLIMQFMLDQGYTGALQMLQQESRLSLQQFCPADNMDLLSVVMEYEQYYEFRFNRKPKLFRAMDAVPSTSPDADGMAVRRRATSHSAQKKPLAANNPLKINYGNAAAGGDGPPVSQETLRPLHLGNPRPLLAASPLRQQAVSTPTSPRAQPNARGKVFSADANGMALAGQRIEVPSDKNWLCSGEAAEEEFGGGRLAKPLPRFPTAELQELAMAIQRDILDVNPNVRWSSIAALDQAKQLLKEAVVIPVKYPQLFEGIVRPWKGILLFGPPGTGKTLLSKAVATECRTTFFNISASSVVSKWRGDSEKLVRLLFDLAVHYAPSTIFIDEIDSLMSSRSGDAIHEGSRRMKTELLIQMDGLSKRKGGEVVFVMAASNVPWDLDMAMLRRLEKRILVGLPTREARATIFRQLLLQSVRGELDWNACADISEGMSGADIDIVCREAMMRPIRLMIEKLEAAGCPKDLAGLSLERPRVTFDDVRASIACTQSSVRQSDLEKYDQWVRKYGSGISS